MATIGAALRRPGIFRRVILHQLTQRRKDPLQRVMPPAISQVTSLAALPATFLAVFLATQDRKLRNSRSPLACLAVIPAIGRRTIASHTSRTINRRAALQARTTATSRDSPTSDRL